MIPGPKAHKDLNTFLYPIVEKLQLLGKGVSGIFNSFTQTNCTLRAHLLVVSGDGPASAEAICMKKPGQAFRPCHQCQIKRKRNAYCTPYYLPHTPEELDNLTLRAHLREIIQLFDTVSHSAYGQELSTNTGIVKATILLQLPTLSFPQSFPLDLMHCVLQNLTPLIHREMGGQKQTNLKAKLAETKYRKRVQQDFNIPTNTVFLRGHLIPPLPCIIPEREWANIGQCGRSNLVDLYLLGQGPRPINTRYGGYKAMEWEAFLVRDSLALLSHYCDINNEFKPYLVNFKLLRTVCLQAKSWHISRSSIAELKLNCKEFVRTFEELYYRQETERLEVCRINNHSILHLGIY